MKRLEVNPTLRNLDRTDGVFQKIAPEEQTTCNIEWFLAQQQYTRTPIRSGLKTQGGERNLAALSSSQSQLRRSRASLMLNSRQSKRSNMFVNTPALTKSTAPSEFGFLTQKRLGDRLDSASESMNKTTKSFKKTPQAALSLTQLNRKLHSDLQEYATTFIEQKSKDEKKIATRLRLSISQLRQSQQFQTLAIKFWMMIINLQYDDVKKLSMSFSDRQLAIHYEHLYMNEVEVIHTSLPVDFIVYERVIPLFLQALGCLGDPDFKAAQIPVSHQVQNRIIKRKQKLTLLKGQIHFDKFLVDLALMIGQNLLKMTVNEVCFIYRIVYQAMTHRFPEDMNFIQCNQIQSAFGIETILQLQRARGVTPQQPLIIPSQVQSGSDERIDSNSGDDGMNILQSNEPPKLEFQQFDPTEKQLPRRSFNLGRDSQPLSVKNAPVCGQSQVQEGSSKTRRYTSFTNLNVGQAMRLTSGPTEDRLEVLPAPPHLKRDSKMSNDSRSELSAQLRQRIQVGVPNPIENALSEEQKGQDEHNDTEEQSSTSELQEEKTDENSNEDKNSIQENDSNLNQNDEKQKKTKKDNYLFDFDALHAARYNFTNNLKAKRSMMQQRVEQLIPFQTLFTRKSCLEYLPYAKEFLADEEIRVAKTPAGFSRPKMRNHKTQIVLHKKGKRKYSPKRRYNSTDQGNSPQQVKHGQFVRTATKLLDQAINEPIDQQNQEMACRNKHDTIQEAEKNREQTNCTAKLSPDKVKIKDESELQMKRSLTKGVEDQSPKLAAPEPLAQYHFKKQSSQMSLDESGYSSGLSSRPPIVHVRKYGSPQDLANSDEGGNFQRIRLVAPEQNLNDNQKNITLQSNFSYESPKSGPTANFFNEKHQGVQSDINVNAVAGSRVNMMTRRLLQEKLLEKVIKARLVENARFTNTGAANSVQNEEFLQLEKILKKLDPDELIRQQNRILQKLQQRQSVDPTAESLEKIYDVSVSQAQRSLEENPPTHATSSQEDSQFVVQEPVTRPKFNMDFPQDVFEKQPQQQPTTINFAKESVTLVTGQSSPTPASRLQQQSFHEVATLTSINRSRMDPSVRFPHQNSVRKRVFYNGNNQSAQNKLSPIYDRLQQAQVGGNFTSPIHVQAVGKNDIEEMEGTTHTANKFVRMVNASSGLDKNSSAGNVTQLKALGPVSNTRVVPLSTNSQQNSNKMRFDNNRKSYVTAQLSGKEIESDIMEQPDVRNLEADQGMPCSNNLLMLKKNPSSFAGEHPDKKSQFVEGNVSGASLSRSNTLGRNVLKKMRNSSQPGQTTSHHSSAENFSMIRRFQNLSAVSKRASIAGWKSQSSTNLPEQKLNQTENQKQKQQELQKKQLDIQQQRRRRGSHISVQFDKAKRQLEEKQELENAKKQKREQQVQGILVKQEKMFPFSQHANELLTKPTPQSTTNSQTMESNKLQTSIFALRRANKNRRTQLHKATASRKERIIQSKIPGVDYRRHIKSGSPVNLVAQKGASNNTTVFAVPDYLFQKLLIQQNQNAEVEEVRKVNNDLEFEDSKAPTALLNPTGTAEMLSYQERSRLKQQNGQRNSSQNLIAKGASLQQQMFVGDKQSHGYTPPKTAQGNKYKTRIINKKPSDISTQLLDQQSHFSPLGRQPTGQLNSGGLGSNFSLGLKMISDTEPIEESPSGIQSRDRRNTEYMASKNTRIIGFLEQSNPNLTEAGDVQPQGGQDEEMLVLIDDNSPKVDFTRKMINSNSSKSSPPLAVKATDSPNDISHLY